MPVLPLIQTKVSMWYQQVYFLLFWLLGRWGRQVGIGSWLLGSFFGFFFLRSVRGLGFGSWRLFWGLVRLAILWYRLAVFLTASCSWDHPSSTANSSFDWAHKAYKSIRRTDGVYQAPSHISSYSIPFPLNHAHLDRTSHLMLLSNRKRLCCS